MMAAWFKPRRYGYGATPIAWQGWALTFGFLVAVVIWAWLCLGHTDAELSAWNFVAFFAGEAILVAALWIVSIRTTDGEWRWRWGEE
jgi:hypothetical protein